jgi:geranylgeranyl diphosphate synthase type II
MNLKSRITNLHKKVDVALERWLPDPRTSTIHRAMHYSIFAGGKRLRPILCLAAAEVCGGAAKSALPAACAVECIHTYSLIHDDLPCMDDDDFRRGRPTSHKVFGEGVAVLAGDALLTIAFEMLARTKQPPRHPFRSFVSELATAAGSAFLIGGQVADLEAENKKIPPRELLHIHRGKTAAMIAVSLQLGAMAANAKPSEVKALKSFGENLGMAFQVIDDILDVTQSSEKLGKSAGKDVTSGKATFVSVFGLEKARKEAAKYTKLARESLAPLGQRATFLHEIADYLLSREA